MVGFRNNPIFRQSSLVPSGSTQHDKSGIVVFGFCVVLGLNALVAGCIRL